MLVFRVPIPYRLHHHHPRTPPPTTLLRQEQKGELNSCMFSHVHVVCSLWHESNVPNVLPDFTTKKVHVLTSCKSVGIWEY